MATKTTKVLKTQFTCENGKSMSVSLDSYNPALTDSDIQTGVEAMLASGALAQGDASAVAAIGAQKVDTTTVDVVFA